MKVTDKIRKEAADIAHKLGLKQIFINEKGEFFSNQSYAAHSVGGDKNKYAEVALGVVVETTATNDLGKAADVIAAIEATDDTEAVLAILKAEQEGKNRKSVVEAAEKKLTSLAAKQQDTNGTDGENSAAGGEKGDDSTDGDSAGETTDTDTSKTAE